MRVASPVGGPRGVHLPENKQLRPAQQLPAFSLRRLTHVAVTWECDHRAWPWGPTGREKAQSSTARIGAGKRALNTEEVPKSAVNLPPRVSEDRSSASPSRKRCVWREFCQPRLEQTGTHQTCRPQLLRASADAQKRLGSKAMHLLPGLELGCLVTLLTLQVLEGPAVAPSPPEGSSPEPWQKAVAPSPGQLPQRGLEGARTLLSSAGSLSSSAPGQG